MIVEPIIICVHSIDLFSRLERQIQYTWEFFLVSSEHYVATMAIAIAVNPDISEYIKYDTVRWRGHY